VAEQALKEWEAPKLQKAVLFQKTVMDHSFLLIMVAMTRLLLLKKGQVAHFSAPMTKSKVHSSLLTPIY
jgi:hypothetical protein